MLKFYIQVHKASVTRTPWLTHLVFQPIRNSFDSSRKQIMKKTNMYENLLVMMKVCSV